MNETNFPLNPKDTKERCGLFLSDGTLVELTNIAAEPNESYEMDPIVVLQYFKKIIGTWHTHPQGPPNLSGADHDNFLLWPQWEHVIYSPGAVKRYCVKDGVVLECD